MRVSLQKMKKIIIMFKPKILWQQCTSIADIASLAYQSVSDWHAAWFCQAETARKLTPSPIVPAIGAGLAKLDPSATAHTENTWTVMQNWSTVPGGCSKPISSHFSPSLSVCFFWHA